MSSLYELISAADSDNWDQIIGKMNKIWDIVYFFFQISRFINNKE